MLHDLNFANLREVSSNLVVFIFVNAIFDWTLVLIQKISGVFNFAKVTKVCIPRNFPVTWYKQVRGNIII